MKKIITRLASLLLSLLLLTGTLAGCESMTLPEGILKETANISDKKLTVQLDVEVITRSNVIMMVTSADDIFKEDISAGDLEVSVLPKNGSEAKAVELGNLLYQAPNRIMMNFDVDGDIELAAIRILPSATLTGKEYVGATGDIIHTEGAGEQDVLKGIEQLKGMLSSGVLDYGKAIISCGVSAYSTLQALGFIKDPVQSNLQQIILGINGLSAEMDSMNIKLDTIYQSLKAELDKINVTTRETLHATYANTWQAFKTDYLDTNGGISQQVVRFNNLYSINFCNFADRTGSFSICYDTNGNVTKPLSSIYTEGQPRYSLDGTLIDESRTVTFEIGADTFAHTKSLAIRAIDNGTFYNTFVSELRAALIANGCADETNADALTADAMNAISIEAIMNTVNTASANGTVGDDLVDSFALFCAHVTAADPNPVEAYHKLVETHYNFQSEAKDDILAFNEYLLAIAAEASAYAELAGKFGSIQQSKKDLIRQNAANVVSFFNTHTGLVPDVPGTQYCYTTHSYIAATQYNAILSETIDCHIANRVFYNAGCYDSHSFNVGWDRTPENVLSTSDLLDLYAVYTTLFKNGKTFLSFKDYFMTNLASGSVYSADFHNAAAEGLISGTTFATRNFPLDGSTSLKAYSDVFNGQDSRSKVCDPVEYFKKGKIYKIGTEFEDGSKEYIAAHASVYSDVMDLTTCQFKTDQQLLSGAMYIEEQIYYAVAELWEFGGAIDLTNKNAWCSIELSSYGDPSLEPPTNFYTWHPLSYCLNGIATFWAIVKVQ